MIRKSVTKFLLASFAVAALTGVSAPVQAATSEETAASAEAWCDVVPPFCGRRCGETVRCQPR